MMDEIETVVEIVSRTLENFSEKNIAEKIAKLQGQYIRSLMEEALLTREQATDMLIATMHQLKASLGD